MFRYPGATELTRIFQAPSSRARARVMASKPPWWRRRRPCRDSREGPTTEEMLTIDPPCSLSRIWRMTRRVRISVSAQVGRDCVVKGAVRHHGQHAGNRHPRAVHQPVRRAEASLAAWTNRATDGSIANISLFVQKVGRGARCSMNSVRFRLKVETR